MIRRPMIGVQVGADQKWCCKISEYKSRSTHVRDKVGQGLERGRRDFEGGLDQAAHRVAEAQATVGV